MSFEDFEKVETRKTFQGMYEGTDYFVRFVKDWHEVDEQYGDVCYENAGYAKISAWWRMTRMICSRLAATNSKTQKC
jgi:predicted nucleotidyltransferase